MNIPLFTIDCDTLQRIINNSVSICKNDCDANAKAETDTCDCKDNETELDETQLDETELEQTQLDNTNNNICLKCKKGILDFFVDSCYIFETNLLLNKHKKKFVFKTEMNGFYFYFDEEEIKKDFNVISAWDFVDTALKNIYFNKEECHNMYYNVCRMLVDGRTLKMLEDDKRYIKFYVHMKPSPDSYKLKSDKKRYLYFK